MKELKLTVKIMHSPCVEHIISLVLRLSSRNRRRSEPITSMINVVQFVVSERLQNDYMYT